MRKRAKTELTLLRDMIASPSSSTKSSSLPAGPSAGYQPYHYGGRKPEPLPQESICSTPHAVVGSDSEYLSSCSEIDELFDSGDLASLHADPKTMASSVLHQNQPADSSAHNSACSHSANSAQAVPTDDELLAMLQTDSF